MLAGERVRRWCRAPLFHSSLPPLHLTFQDWWNWNVCIWIPNHSQGKLLMTQLWRRAAWALVRLVSARRVSTDQKIHLSNTRVGGSIKINWPKAIRDRTTLSMWSRLIKLPSKLINSHIPRTGIHKFNQENVDLSRSDILINETVRNQIVNSVMKWHQWNRSNQVWNPSPKWNSMHTRKNGFQPKADSKSAERFDWLDWCSHWWMSQMMP